jgi:aldose 1-epimerase
VTAAFTVSDVSMTVQFEATCDQPTPVALTYPPYFNLAGDPTVPAHEQVLRISAESYLPVGSTQLLPTGSPASVRGTPFDFRVPRRIGAVTVPSSHQQLELAAGYDHCFLLDSIRRCDADLLSLASGVSMRILSDQPAVQFYGGQHLGAGQSGICLEPGSVPNAVNGPTPESVTLRPGSVYRACIEYRFGG